MKYLFMLLVFTSLAISASFTKKEDVVIDKENSLIWQDNKDTVEKKFNFKDTMKYCENLKLYANKSWRVPTREEFEYIINKTRKDELMINKKFRYILPSDYWTNESTWRSLGRYGYYVKFKSGNIYYQNKSYKMYVRCVATL